MAGEWPITKVGDVCSRVTKGTTPTTGGGSFSDHGIAFIKVESITESGGFLPDKFAFIDAETDERLARSRLRENDILFTIAGTIGRVALVTSEILPGNTNQAVAIVRPAPQVVYPRFLYYVLRDDARVQLAQSRVVQSVQANFSLGELSSIELPLPPLPEQRAIAHILGTLDDKIELNRRRNQTLEAMARALFKDWFIDFGPIRAKMEGRACQDGARSGQPRTPQASDLPWPGAEAGAGAQGEPYLPADLWQRFPDRLDDEGKPEGWEMQPLSALFVIIGGGTPKTSVAEYWDGDIPWFSVVDTPAASDVFVISTEKSITEQGLAGSSARLIPKGTTIISARGTVGNLAIAGREMTFNQSFYGLGGNERVGDYFVYLTAQQMVDQLKSMAHGSVFSTITRQTFEAIQRPAPSPEILRAFEQAVSAWFETILSNVEESRTLAQLRDTLLPKLISGELRIADAETFMERVA